MKKTWADRAELRGKHPKEARPAVNRPRVGAIQARRVNMEGNTAADVAGVVAIAGAASMAAGSLSARAVSTDPTTAIIIKIINRERPNRLKRLSAPPSSRLLRP